MIDPNKFYTPQDDALRPLGAVQTLARQRHEGKGPAYHKLGNRVLYKGADILDYLVRQRVETSVHGSISDQAVQASGSEARTSGEGGAEGAAR